MERHEIVLGVQADVTRARAELEALEKIAMRLRAALGGGGGTGMPVGIPSGPSAVGMPPMPPPGSPGGPPGMGNSSTVPSGVAVSTPGEAGTTGYVPRALPPRDAGGRFISPSAVAPSTTVPYAPPGVPSSSTPSTVAPSPPGGGGGGSTVPSGGPPGSGGGGGGSGGGGGGSGWTFRGGNALANVFANQITSGNTSGAVGGLLGVLGQMAGFSNPATALMSTVGRVIAAGIDSNMSDSDKRGVFDKTMGAAQFGGDALMGSSWRDRFSFGNINSDFQTRLWNRDQRDKFRTVVDEAERVAGGSRAILEGTRVGLSMDEIASARATYAASMGGYREHNAFGKYDDERVRSRSAVGWTMAGLDPSTTGSFARQFILQGARTGSEDPIDSFVRIGQGMGVRGAINEWVGQIISQTEKLANQGIKVNLDAGPSGGVSGLLRRIQQTVQANDPFTANRFVSGMQDTSAGMKQRFLQPFGSAMDAIAAVQASRGAKSPADYVSNLERQAADPNILVDEARRLLPKGVAELVFASRGNTSMDFARKIAGGLIDPDAGTAAGDLPLELIPEDTRRRRGIALAPDARRLMTLKIDPDDVEAWKSIGAGFTRGLRDVFDQAIKGWGDVWRDGADAQLDSFRRHMIMSIAEPE